MTVQRFVLTFAGSLILVSIALARLVHPAFLILTASFCLSSVHRRTTGDG